MIRDTRITMRLTGAQREAIEKAAAADSRSISSYVVIAALEKVSKSSPEGKKGKRT